MAGFQSKETTVARRALARKKNLGSISSDYATSQLTWASLFSIAERLVLVSVFQSVKCGKITQELLRELNVMIYMN